MQSREYACWPTGAIRVDGGQKLSIFGDSTVFAGNSALTGGKEVRFANNANGVLKAVVFQEGLALADVMGEWFVLHSLLYLLVGLFVICLI